MSTVGKRIKELRTKNNISQTELADKVNISKQTLYKYENDIVTNIPSDKIENIAMILNTTPGYLMGWETDMLYKEPPIETLIEHFNTEEKSKLLTIAAFMKENPEEFESLMKIIKAMNKKEN